MDRSIHETMRLLAAGQTWVTESGVSRKILELKFTGAHCSVRYIGGREYVCHSHTFSAWVNTNKASKGV